MTTGQRILLRVVSALVALCLVAAGALVIGQVVVGMTSGHDFLVPTAQWYDTLRATPWSDGSVVYAAIALIVVGLLLLAVVVLSRPRLFTLTRPDDSVDVTIPPRAVAQMLRRQAEAVPGVGSASAEVARDLARISATAALVGSESLEERLADALSHALRTIPWAHTPRLEIEVLGVRPTAADNDRAAGVSS